MYNTAEEATILNVKMSNFSVVSLFFKYSNIFIVIWGFRNNSTVPLFTQVFSCRHTYIHTYIYTHKYLQQRNSLKNYSCLKGRIRMLRSAAASTFAAIQWAAKPTLDVWLLFILKPLVILGRGRIDRRTMTTEKFVQLLNLGLF